MYRITSSSFVKLPHLTYVLNKSTAVGSNNYSIKIDYKGAVNLDEEQLTFSGNIGFYIRHYNLVYDPKLALGMKSIIF